MCTRRATLWLRASSLKVSPRQATWEVRACLDQPCGPSPVSHTPQPPPPHPHTHRHDPATPPPPPHPLAVPSTTRLTSLAPCVCGVVDDGGGPSHTGSDGIGMRFAVSAGTAQQVQVLLTDVVLADNMPGRSPLSCVPWAWAWGWVFPPVPCRPPPSMHMHATQSLGSLFAVLYLEVCASPPCAGSI
jgi:hypothetical protein